MKSSACFLSLKALRFCKAATSFPPAGSGKGFKPRAAYAYAWGVRFSIHIMRGIPKQAVKEMEPCLSRLDALRVNRTCGNKPLNIDSQEVCGIGTHSEAIIRDLSNGYDTFSARGSMTNKKSPEFRVPVDQGKTDVPTISKVSFDFQALGIHGKA